MSLEHSPARSRKDRKGGRAAEPLWVDDPTLTVDGFCAAEHISRKSLYDFWKQGIGPDFYFVGVERRITREARRRWQLEREAAARAKAAGALQGGA
jgi:hypothetical protein